MNARQTCERRHNSGSSSGLTCRSFKQLRHDPPRPAQQRQHRIKPPNIAGRTEQPRYGQTKQWLLQYTAANAFKFHVSSALVSVTKSLANKSECLCMFSVLNNKPRPVVNKLLVGFRQMQPTVPEGAKK
jgi:hypothetical protein